jgi:baculoviral IAP repeat-containing protein 6
MDIVAENDHKNHKMKVSSVPSFDHHHFARPLGSPPSGYVRRLQREFEVLETSLPDGINGIHVLRSDECIAQCKVMIAGPAGTPYSGGLFMFDALFPYDYPHSPPKVNLMTTGRGTVALNPNLYKCGRVCLSLLGTFLGDGCENWSHMSSFLQVVVSIQSLIMVPEPWYNEPGREHDPARSAEYNRSVRHDVERWAIRDMRHNPPAGFEEVVKTHFSHKP